MRQARRAEALSEIASSIASNRYIEEILQLIVTMAAQMMDSRICTIMLYDQKKGELRIAATQSRSAEYASKPNLRIGQSVSGNALRIKKPVAVLDVRDDPAYMFPEMARREGLVSLLSVPMLIRDRAVGVINTYTGAPHVFTADEIKMMQAVANQAAVALDNTMLLGRVVEMEETIDTRRAVERAKGILMKEQGIGEDEAYQAIQRASRTTGRRMKDVAEALILDREVRKR